MAWQCSAQSNTALVSNLVAVGILSTPRVIAAFNAVDRAHFVSDPAYTYKDSPSYIGSGATISAPHMHAYATESLASFLSPTASVLDVGSGSGYLLSVFHHLSPHGRILGIDHLQSLVDLSVSNLSKSSAGKKAMEEGLIRVIKADGREGAPAAEVPEGGWDVIHVGAAAERMPERLVEQLKSPGRMWIPVGTDEQAIWSVDKDEKGEVTKTRVMGVNYIPLTDAHLQFHS